MFKFRTTETPQPKGMTESVHVCACFSGIHTRNGVAGPQNMHIMYFHRAKLPSQLAASIYTPVSGIGEYLFPASSPILVTFYLLLPAHLFYLLGLGLKAL